jgi:hypothetical protein
MDRLGSNHSVKTIRVLTSDEFDATFSFADDDGRPRPVRINPESQEEREKRLAKRKERTLKAFQKTYENRRKAS